MASFSAELRVESSRFVLLRCTYHTTQATDGRSRVNAKVRYGHVRILLDVPDQNLLESWAANS